MTPSSLPWVLVAGGFHRNGGMDKANLALAEYLIDNENPVHLVSHSVAPYLYNHPLVTISLVERPLHSFEFGGAVLNLKGRAIARRVTAQFPGARVLTNGGGCRWNDVSWAHCVHAAWPRADRAAPAWFRLKNSVSKSVAIRNERRAFRLARTVIANSEKTRRDLLQLHGLEPSKVHLVHLGADPDWVQPSSAETCAARQSLGQPPDCPLVVFVGALGLDDNKGFDSLLSAWRLLCKDRGWDGLLIVAGAGRGLSRWQAKCHAEGLSGRVTFLGFTDGIRELLAAADLLISPVRYEAYGLNVQEAICRGVPAIVSAGAGIAERYPKELLPMLIPDPENVPDLIDALRRWRSNIPEWKSRFQPLGRTLRKHSWREMARQIVSIAGRDANAESANLRREVRASG